MKKVCENWKQAFPAGKVSADYYTEFETRAKNAGAEVFKVKSVQEGQQVVTDLAKAINAQKAVIVSNPYQEAAGINQALVSLGVTVYTDAVDIAEHAESADIGISAVEFGIAESGSVCMDGYSFESRLVSMLPPVHVVFLNSNYIVPGINEAFEIISKVFNNGYLSFITGPSRTADIERVLTIGVHGPSRLVIIAVEEAIEGGAQ